MYRWIEAEASCCDHRGSNYRATQPSILSTLAIGLPWCDDLHIILFSLRKQDHLCTIVESTLNRDGKQLPCLT